MTASRSVFLGLLLVAAVLAFVAARPGSAEESSGVELRYISIAGEGSNAKAWYEGAAPGGSKVQEALDRFAREGFRLGSLAPAWRAAVATPGQSTDTAYVLILEKRK